MMISNDLFEICLVGIRTLVRSYINKRALALDWESSLASPAYILEGYLCGVSRTLVHTIEKEALA